MNHVKSDTTTWRQMLSSPSAGHHIVQLYRHEEQLAETASHYISEGLQRGEAVVVVATAAHWTVFVSRLATNRKVDLVDVVMKGQLRIMDAEVTLSAIMSDGMPQWESFRERAGEIIERSRKRFGMVRIYGEQADILWQKGERQAAVRLDEFWNDLGRQHAFSLLCAYRTDDADPKAYNATLESVCRTHTHLVPRLRNAPGTTGTPEAATPGLPSASTPEESI